MGKRGIHTSENILVVLRIQIVHYPVILKANTGQPNHN